MKEAASLEEFVGCKEKLLDLLSAFINILGEKIRPYALEIKVGRRCYTSPDGKMMAIVNIQCKIWIYLVSYPDPLSTLRGVWE